MIQPDSELIQKYNVQGPRYTSYPTAVQFEPINHKKTWEYLSTELNEPKKLSLYVHLPFCQSLCWYCGCTTVISKNPDVSRAYLDSLKIEIEKTAQFVHPDSKVYQLHFGGGTPTFLREQELVELTQTLKKFYVFDENAEISIEIDPRTVTHSQIKALAKVGFNRASIGVQDVNAEVQKAIHRIQSMDQNIQTMEWLRTEGFESINIDLIYGLPKQTPTLFKNTLDVLEFLDPDRIALYSYAHIPWVKPAQKLINDEDLPEPASKIVMLQMAMKQLQEKGFDFIGMDHFAKPNDELAIARKKGTLHRNFQGYSTQANLEMISFGMSGISFVGSSYLQRHRIVQQWSKGVEELGSTFEKGYFLTKDDLIRRDVIMKIMCAQSVVWADIAEQHGISIKTYFKKELKKLAPFVIDRLLSVTDDGISVTENGRFFVRNIAMVFDAYLKKRKKDFVFSKTV